MRYAREGRGRKGGLMWKETRGGGNDEGKDIRTDKEVKGWENTEEKRLGRE